MYDLKFDPEKYEIKTCELQNRSVTYRAFENIVYCAKPVSSVQKLNIYVPEAYYQGKTINGFKDSTGFCSEYSRRIYGRSCNGGWDRSV